MKWLKLWAVTPHKLMLCFCGKNENPTLISCFGCPADRSQKYVANLPIVDVVNYQLSLPVFYPITFWLGPLYRFKVMLAKGLKKSNKVNFYKSFPINDRAKPRTVC